MKKTLTFMVFVSIFLSLTGCIYKEFFGNRPCDQPNTTWISEDESIIIYIDSNWKGTGVLYAGDVPVEFIYANDAGSGIELYLPWAVDNEGTIHYEYRFEYWIGDFKSKDRFTATVKESTFFDTGDKITFYQVDNEEHE